MKIIICSWDTARWETVVLYCLSNRVLFLLFGNGTLKRIDPIESLHQVGTIILYYDYRTVTEIDHWIMFQIESLMNKNQSIMFSDLLQ